MEKTKRVAKEGKDLIEELKFANGLFPEASTIEETIGAGDKELV